MPSVTGGCQGESPVRRLAHAICAVSVAIGTTNPTPGLKRRNPRRATNSRGFLRSGEPISNCWINGRWLTRDLPTPQSHPRRWHRSFMAFEHLAQLTGCAASALILQDICGRMKLAGGAEHDGHHWIYSSGRESAEAGGCCRNHADKLLKKLAEAGLLVRQKLGVLVGLPWVRAWFYRPGPNCPEWLLGKASPTAKANHCPRHGQSKQQPTSTSNNKNRERFAQEQPHPIPDATATKQRIEEEQAMVFVPSPGATARLQGQGTRQTGAPLPAETHEPQAEPVVAESSSRIDSPSPEQSQPRGKGQPRPQQASSAICGSLLNDQCVSPLAPSGGLNQPYPASFSFSR